MFMLLLYLTLVTLAFWAFPGWPTLATLAAPAAVVLALRLALALTKWHKKAPGERSAGGQ